MINRNHLAAALFLAMSWLTTQSVSAHHSSSMYDRDKPLPLTGTVKEFQWTNPHCWIQVLVRGASGDEEWSIQLGAPMFLYRQGWRPGTLKPGEHLDLVVFPAHDGSHGGLLVSATGPDGKSVGPVSPER